jgi:hypothetical protein
MAKRPANQAPAVEAMRERSLLPSAETLQQVVRGRRRALIAMALGLRSILYVVATTAIAVVTGSRFSLLVRLGGFIDATEAERA